MSAAWRLDSGLVYAISCIRDLDFQFKFHRDVLPRNFGKLELDIFLLHIFFLQAVSVSISQEGYTHGTFDSSSIFGKILMGVSEKLETASVAVASSAQ